MLESCQEYQDGALLLSCNRVSEGAVLSKTYAAEASSSEQCEWVGNKNWLSNG